jgi:hypothetical protein
MSDWQIRQARQALRVSFLNFLDRVETTMIYTRVVRDLRNPTRSPLDMLGDRCPQRTVG